MTPNGSGYAANLRHVAASLARRERAAYAPQHFQMGELRQVTGVCFIPLALGASCVASRDVLKNIRAPTLIRKAVEQPRRPLQGGRLALL